MRTNELRLAADNALRHIFIIYIFTLYEYNIQIMADIFSYDDYRSFLKARVKGDKTAWGLWGKLALAAGCQATYLSQAMKGRVHLTSDHIFGIARFLKLSEPEEDYFLLLLDYAKAGTKALQEKHLTRIRRIRKDREDLAKRFQKPKLEVGEAESIYYSAWFWSALHVIITIPEFQSVDAIAKRLLLPPELVEHSLSILEQKGILKKEGRQWRLGSADLHIPKDSPMIGVHHMNWRQKAVLDALTPRSESVHFTAVYSISRADYQHLKEKMLELIEHSRIIVGPSPEEDLICMTCDIFRI